jgi:hypothetical protein
MRRTAVACMALLAPLAAVPAAEAKVAKGSFAGKSDRADPMGFKVDGKGKVFSVYFEGVTLECSDGDTFDTPTGRRRVQVPKKVKFNVGRDRDWGVRARNSLTGFGWDLEGSFNKKGTRSFGKLEVFARFNEKNEQDPKGKVKCKSGPVLWEVKRR